MVSVTCLPGRPVQRRPSGFTTTPTQRRLVLNPSLAAGEAYMDGTLTVEDGTLYDFLDSHRAQHDQPLRAALLTGSLNGLGAASARLLRQFNPVGRAQRNVAHHYDLSGELYDLFLDADRQYSCAYFADADETPGGGPGRQEAPHRRQAAAGRRG